MTASTRRSTCAWNAAPAKRSARSASTWRASRASFWPTTAGGTARRCSARVLGNVAGSAVWGSRFAPHRRTGCRRASRSLAQRKLLGIDQRRTLPAWQRETFEHGGLRQPARSRRRRRVTLFNDTFTNHYDPEIGIAAVEVLERGGCQVECGAAGLLRAAADLARAARARLANTPQQLVDGIAIRSPTRGEKILFCEPSCLSAVKEDAPSLLRGEQQQKRPRRSPMRACCSKNSRPSSICRLQAGPEKILLHGHCHQKSMGLLACHRSAAREDSATQRWWIWMRAAAAWPVRSAIRRITTMCR